MAGKCNEKRQIAIVGGGLVGALNAIYLGNHGYKIDIYECRKDIRTQETYKGRSINLALSARGIEALKGVGLDQMVKESGIPMHGRLIHSLDGKKTFIPYGKKGQHLLSIERGKLNKDLLTEAEKLPNVNLHFEHKLIDADVERGEMHFKVGHNMQSEVHADLIIGNDGAYSIVRKEIMRKTRLNYNQEYIPHGYKELCMLPKDGEYVMESNGLHIWPRNTFMMIALPNQDKSFTCTLFMPFEIFEKIKTKEDIIAFFQKEFPDSIPLYGEDHLVKEYLTNCVSNMISVKCDPYHVKDKVVIFGDAAHAMVPFYGQGMNSGLEDCRVFNGFVEKFNNDLGLAIQAFSQVRGQDAKAICDLSMQNYIEMRSSVNSRLFLIKKRIDNFLHWLMPNTFIPKYSMVSFTTIPYHEVVSRSQWQDKVITKIITTTGLLSAVLVVAVCLKYINKISHQDNIPLIR